MVLGGCRSFHVLVLTATYTVCEPIIELGYIYKKNRALDAQIHVHVKSIFEFEFLVHSTIYICVYLYLAQHAHQSLTLE